MLPKTWQRGSKSQHMTNLTKSMQTLSFGIQQSHAFQVFVIKSIHYYLFKCGRGLSCKPSQQRTSEYLKYLTNSNNAYCSQDLLSHSFRHFYLIKKICKQFTLRVHESCCIYSNNDSILRTFSWVLIYPNLLKSRFDLLTYLHFRGILILVISTNLVRAGTKVIH